MNIIQLKKELKRKIYYATFVKKNGEVRTIHGRLGVKKDLVGKGLKYDAEGGGNLLVWDKKLDEYRTISLDRLITLRYNKKEIAGQYALRMALT